MNFQLSSTSSAGSFDLLDAQETLVTHFQYENWFSSTGTAILNENSVTISPRNIWHSSFDVFVNDEDRGDITFNWQGHILIRLQDQAGRVTKYRLKTKGFRGFQFMVEDEQHTTLMQLVPTFQWTKMGYNYGVEFAETFRPDTDLSVVTLLLACGYGANLYMAMIATMAA